MRTSANGVVRYSHTAVTLVLLAPGQKAVFPLPPAFVVPQDGHDKQDGEFAASGRWLTQWGPRVAPWGVTFLGDDLYGHQPFCRQILAQGCHFLFVCLPPSHATLYEWVADFERVGTVPTRVITRWTGTCRWLPNLDAADWVAPLIAWEEDARARRLPRREYWLAPERHAETMDALRRMSFGFGWLLVGFLAYVQWLVLRANAANPPIWPLTWFVGGLMLQHDFIEFMGQKTLLYIV
jgi:hypothetical protein